VVAQAAAVACPSPVNLGKHQRQLADRRRFHSAVPRLGSCAGSGWPITWAVLRNRFRGTSSWRVTGKACVVRSSSKVPPQPTDTSNEHRSQSGIAVWTRLDELRATAYRSRRGRRSVPAWQRRCRCRELEWEHSLRGLPGAFGVVIPMYRELEHPTKALQATVYVRTTMIATRERPT
jgi:hypothetical protein